MHPARIAELLDPFLGPSGDPRPNTQALIAHISTYIDILQRWNARINLTAIRDPEDIVTRHFGESLFAARHLFPSRNVLSRENLLTGGNVLRGRAALQGRVTGQEMWASAPEGPVNAGRPTPDPRPSLADLGSGAGFPGIPIKLWAPEISLTLIESNQKKATFLRELTRALTLTDVDIQNTRAESLSGTTFDLVTLRAVEHFDSILPIASTLVAPAGRLALLISSAQLPQAHALLPHLSWLDPIPVPLSRSRVLAVANPKS